MPERGDREAVTAPVPLVEWTHKFPVVLPGGDDMLFVIDYEGPKFDVVLRSLTSGRQEVLIPGATWVDYLDPGYLVYTLGEDLWADTFDPVTHRLGGRPVQLSERVRRGIPSFIDLGRNGTLVYSTPPPEYERSLLWVDRDGSVEATGLPTATDYAHLAISPQGTHAVLGFGHGTRGGAVRVWDLDRKTLEPPLASELASFPVWSASGEQIVWYSGDAGGLLFRRAANGAGATEQGGLFEAAPLEVLEDGRVLHYHNAPQSKTDGDLFLTPFDGNALTGREPLLILGGSQVYGTLSRDGRWLAYMTYSLGVGAQVFVAPVPVEGPGTQVSFEGGAYPRWSRDGDELFFSNKGKLMVVAVTSRGDDLEFGEPTLIYDGVTTTDWPGRPFDVTPDGQRCLVIEEDSPDRPEIRLVINFVEEVRATLEDRD